MSLIGKRALVTGASSGIGKDIAFSLAKRGCNLVLSARREQRLLELKAELENQYSISVDVVPVDLAKTSEITSYVEQVGEIDLLVNNAGLGNWIPYKDIKEESILNELAVNNTALVLLTRKFLNPMLKKNHQCYILNVGSVASFIPVANFSIYCATKAFVGSFTITLQEELKSTNVQVSGLYPGGTSTEFFDTSKQTFSKMGQKSMMTSQEVAEIAVSSMLNGKTIIVPGFTNKLSCWLMKFLPKKLATTMAFKIYTFFVKNN